MKSMKAVFAHDHIFKEDIKGKYYTGACYNNSVWERYLKHFKKIKVIARLDKNKIGLNNEFNEFSLPGISFRAVPSLSSPVSQFKNKKAVIEILKDEIYKADVLIARLPSETGNSAIKLAREMGKPYLVEVVGCIWDSLWNYGNIKGKIYAPIALKKMQKNVRLAPYAIYVTNNFLQNRYPCYRKTEKISNEEIKDINQDSLQYRKERYSKNKRLNTIGMIGSLDNKIKGLEVAFKALKLLKDKNIDFNFRILGAGDQEPWKHLAKELGIESKIDFCGLLPGGDPVLRWLDDIDIYIQPSFQEGLPRAIIEAMSRGCPVIGSSAGGIPELIHPSMIHKPGNVDKLYSLIKETLINSNSLLSNAKINFKLSKEYLKDNLDRKRYGFLNSVFEKQN